MRAVIGLGHSPSLRRMEARVKKAIEVYFDRGDVLMFTGGYNGRVHEAEYMRSIASNIPDRNIVLEPDAHSTLENARFSYKILKELGCDAATIVTSRYQMHRARKIFAKEMPDIALDFVVSDDPVHFDIPLRYAKEAICLAYLYLMN